MDSGALMRAVDQLEAQLIDASQEIDEIGAVDSMRAWLTVVLQRHPGLASQLGLPTAPGVVKALLILLSADSELRNPLTTMLAQRTGALIATIRDVCAHPLSPPAVRASENHVRHLEGLLDEYQWNYDRRKSIRQVGQALVDHRLESFKTSPRESDLRVILRAFYEDDSRDDGPGVAALLDYVHRELLAELAQPSRIPQPRHAWWAIESLFREASSDWLHERRTSLNAVISQLVSDNDYRPRRDADYTSFVPELHSAQNEELWVCINGLKILTGSNSTVVSASNVERIERRAEDAVNGIVQMRATHLNLKLVQSRLILLYEALRHAALRRALEMATAQSLELGGAKIGSLFYEPTVVEAVDDIKRKLQTFVDKPTAWTRGTQTAMVISGAAGQGKTALAEQVVAELGEMVETTGKTFDPRMYSIGGAIKQAADLEAILEEMDAAPDDHGVVRCVIFDEFDKAPFDFSAYFLQRLETPTSGPVTTWIFAQSRASSLAELKAYADGLEVKSMRDFLTRMQLGSVDVPHIKYHPSQKIYTALGMAHSMQPRLKRVDRDLIIDLCRRPDVETSRDLRRILSSECDLTANALKLKVSTPYALRFYRNFVGSFRARWLPVTL